MSDTPVIPDLQPIFETREEKWELILKRKSHWWARA